MSNKILAEYLSVDKLRPFEGHPFQVKDDEEMNQLVWSIITQGVLNPIMVRPLNTGEYEVISGHRRVHACQKAGIDTIPALIYSLERDAAAIALVDSNLHREHILPSEKAFAYKLKRDAMNHQGKTSPQLGEKLLTVEKIGLDSGDSKNQVLRYIRLTYLIPEILRMVDGGRIALTPAVELSYLTEAEQRDLLETMECEDCTPSLSQAQQMKLLSQRGELTMDRIFEMLRAPKPNQQEKISLDYGQLRRYFPRSYTPKDVLNAILRLVEADYKRRQQRREER
ncbi:MAG: ParB/RepB/Spo0J family partition protein [Oscillospiraceae bacterium]|nr:ParB/RepB/Spo0J family partition protein [Oscillospiraceae bacterium]